MIFDEQDLVKTLKKIDCFEAIGYAILAEGATAAAAATAGMAATSLAVTVVGTGFKMIQEGSKEQPPTHLPNATR